MPLFSIALRHVRRLSTAASAVAGATEKPLIAATSVPKLAKVLDPDEVLNIDNHTFMAGNCPLSQHTLRRLARSGQLSDIESLLESHKSSSYINQEHFASTLIRGYGAAKMFENALNTYQQMTEFGTPRSVLTFNSLLWACFRCKLFDRVATYFDEFPAKFGFSPDKFSYGMLIKSYCKMNMPEIAIEKLNELSDKGVELDSFGFNAIFQYLYLKERAQEAELFWDEMVKEKGFKPDTVSYKVKLDRIQPGDTDGFNRLIEEMNNAGILPDTYICDTIISFYCANEMIDEANKAYFKMLSQKGCHPSPPTFRTLLSHMCKAGQFVLAYRMFNMSAHEKKFKKIVRNRSKHSLHLWKCLAEGLENKGHTDEAKELIRRVEKFCPVKISWGQLAAALELDLDETKGGNLAPHGAEEVDSGKIENALDSKV